MIFKILLPIFLFFISFKISHAHVSERALTLLLPTEYYIPAGISVLVLTILITYITPKAFIGFLFKPFEIKSIRISDYFFSDYIDIFRVLISLLSFLLLILLVILGFIGSRDPLANPLSLFIWSIWFLIMPLVQIVFGNIWTFLNPWYGIGRLLFKNRYIFKLDNNLSLIFPSISFLLFSLFMLVDIAPDDPDRLANVVCIYFLLNFIFIWLFGMSWLDKESVFQFFLICYLNYLGYSFEMEKLILVFLVFN